MLKRTLITTGLFALIIGACEPGANGPAKERGAAQSGGTDLSGLYSKKTEPTLASIKAAMAEYKAFLLTQDPSPAQETAFQKLEYAMLTTTTPATLERKPSKGPDWRDELIAWIEDNSDIHETLSYADEDGAVSEQCGFQDGIEDEDEYRFVYEAVKPIGTDKTIAYIVSLEAPFAGRDLHDKLRWCTVTVSEWAFENDPSVVPIEDF